MIYEEGKGFEIIHSDTWGNWYDKDFKFDQEEGSFGRVWQGDTLEYSLAYYPRMNLNLGTYKKDGKDCVKLLNPNDWTTLEEYDVSLSVESSELWPDSSGVYYLPRFDYEYGIGDFILTESSVRYTVKNAIFVFTTSEQLIQDVYSEDITSKDFNVTGAYRPSVLARPPHHRESPSTVYGYNYLSGTPGLLNTNDGLFKDGFSVGSNLPYNYKYIKKGPVLVLNLKKHNTEEIVARYYCFWLAYQYTQMGFVSLDKNLAYTLCVEDVPDYTQLSYFANQLGLFNQEAGCLTRSGADTAQINYSNFFEEMYINMKTQLWFARAFVLKYDRSLPVGQRFTVSNFTGLAFKVNASSWISASSLTEQLNFKNYSKLSFIYCKKRKNTSETDATLFDEIYAPNPAKYSENNILSDLVDGFERIFSKIANTDCYEITYTVQPENDVLYSAELFRAPDNYQTDWQNTPCLSNIRFAPNHSLVLNIQPDIIIVDAAEQTVLTTLTFNDWEGGIPAEELYVENDLGLIDYKLPETYSETNTYELNIDVPINLTNDIKVYYFTVKTNDDEHEAKLLIVQKAPEVSDVRLYFSPDNISVDATDNVVTVTLFYNGKGSPFTDLNITTSWREEVQLPKTISLDGFYNITLNIGMNSGYEARDLTVDVETKDKMLDNTLYIYQRGALLPDTEFYWDRSSYSIEFNQEYVDAVLHYDNHIGGIPFETLNIAPESTFRDFVLPDTYSEDGIYTIRFKIGPNIDYEVKKYIVVLEEKYTGNTQAVSLSIGSKQSSQLYWVPDNLTINNDQESVLVNYFWNDFLGGDPSHTLIMSSDIPGFVPYLPDTVSPDNNYTFAINLGKNTDLSPRNYTVTLRSADRFYSSVLYIMQYGTGGEADFTYYFERQNITAPASGIVPNGYISNKLIGSLSSLTGQFEIISTPYWIKKENIRFDKDAGLIIIDKEEPNVFAERSGKVLVLFYSSDGKTHAAEFTVTQVAGEIEATNIIPIWRDTWVNIDADYNYFRLVNKETNEIYFNGLTIQGEIAQFKINNIVSDYMTVWKTFGSSLQNGNSFTTSPVLISVSCSRDGANFDYTIPEIYKFIWDYSYDKNVPDILTKSNVINYYDPRQKMMISTSNRSNYEMNTKIEGIFANDTKYTIDDYILLPGEMRASFVPAYSGPGDGAVKVRVSSTVQGQTKILEYLSKCTKANYVLHYVNRYGQVCWMLFAGRQIKTDNITSSKFILAYDNNYKYNFENVVYQNKVEESWQLTTSYLTDKLSEDLTDLYSSPIVFLEDLNADNTDNIIAVTVETKSVDYKNYKNQGKFFTHTIKVQNAQNKFILL